MGWKQSLTTVNHQSGMIRASALAGLALIWASTGCWAQNQAEPESTDPPQKDLGEPQKPKEPDARDLILFSDETERIGPLTKKLTRNVLLDQAAIWTSPLHMSRDDVIAWGIIGAGIGGAIASDHWTVKQLPNTVDQVSISQDVSQLGAAYTVLPITAGLYIGGAIFHNPKARETGILGGEALLDSLIVEEALKVTIRRPRPLEDNGSGSFFAGGASFPSGHATQSFALASVVAHEYNKNILYPIAAYGLASLVSFSRLSGQQHFPSDIVAGGAIGWYIGRYVFKTHVDHSIHARPASKLSQLRPVAIPQFDSATGTRGVVLMWSQTSSLGAH
jgi:hypothetical protein